MENVKHPTTQAAAADPSYRSYNLSVTLQRLNYRLTVTVTDHFCFIELNLIELE